MKARKHGAKKQINLMLTVSFFLKILGTRNADGLTKLNFVTFFNNQTVPSDVIVKDISLLTLSHLSAALQYPVIDIRGNSTGGIKMRIICIIFRTIRDGTYRTISLVDCG